MLPKETFWKGHAWLCVPSPGTVFSLGCETGFGSCSVSLDQGQVNCSLRLKIKLSSQNKNIKHLTRKSKPMDIQLSWEISCWSYEVSESLICIYVFVCMSVYTYLCMVLWRNCWKAIFCFAKSAVLCVHQQTIKTWVAFIFAKRTTS